MQVTIYEAKRPAIVANATPPLAMPLVSSGAASNHAVPSRRAPFERFADMLREPGSRFGKQVERGVHARLLELCDLVAEPRRRGNQARVLAVRQPRGYEHVLHVACHGQHHQPDFVGGADLVPEIGIRSVAQDDVAARLPVPGDLVGVGVEPATTSP